MTVEEAFKKGAEILKKGKIEVPAREAGVLLSFILQKDKSYIYAHGKDEMPEDRIILWEKLFAQRAAGKPLQYITGEQEFMSLRFSVDERVLIPRHDTETLVEAVIDYVKNHTRYEAGADSRHGKGGGAEHGTGIGARHVANDSSGHETKTRVDSRYGTGRGFGEYSGKLLEKSGAPLRILDIGTGSGCIAVSLAYYLENCVVTAVDISEGALEIARENAERAGVAGRIEFIKSDLFSALASPEGPRLFDVIVSNPPYIPESQRHTLQREVREYEPALALFAGEDGLEIICRIIEQSPDHLAEGGRLFIEVGQGQAGNVLKLMEPHFTRLEIHRDMAGIERVVSGQVRDLWARLDNK